MCRARCCIARTMKKDCPAKVVVAARRSGAQQLEITELKTEHNHEVSYEIFRTYPECRHLSAEEVDFVKPLMELNVLPSLIVEKLKERSVLLAGFIDKHLCQRVLDGSYLLEETDVEVRPEALPSALLDCRVSLPRLKKYFTPDAWTLLTSSVTAKKSNELWICSLCKEKDDGELKMVCCEQCLEWFHCTDITHKNRSWFKTGRDLRKMADAFETTRGAAAVEPQGWIFMVPLDRLRFNASRAIQQITARRVAASLWVILNSIRFACLNFCNR